MAFSSKRIPSASEPHELAPSQRPFGSEKILLGLEIDDA
jgi:hypothetical protein